MRNGYPENIMIHTVLKHDQIMQDFPVSDWEIAEHDNLYKIRQTLSDELYIIHLKRDRSLCPFVLLIILVCFSLPVRSTAIPSVS